MSGVFTNEHARQLGIALLEAAPAGIADIQASWIKIAPRGRFVCRDGRQFDVDPEALVARFEADGIDIPVDLDHATTKKAIFGDEAPAVGWIGELTARPDGLYGRVDWLSTGREVIQARSHRYLSPTFKLIDGTDRVAWVHSVALVAAPAVSMPEAVLSSSLVPMPAPSLLTNTQTLGADTMRVITAAVLEALFKGFKTEFFVAFNDVPSHHLKVAMKTTSTTGEEVYGWLGSFPNMREWVGDRHVHGLKAHGFSIKNKKFESTVVVSRDDISDDKLGIYKPRFQEMGRVAKQHPDTLIFDLLKRGFMENCYDGQFFFDTEHPVGDGDNMEPISVSNVQDGAGPAWFLIDGGRAVKPIIWQEREGYEFQSLDALDHERVFMRDEFLYGIRARVNAGFGLWQLAFASKAELTPENYAAARAAMKDFRADNGTLLGVNPTHLIVPPALETAARNILFADQIDGTSNIWKGTAEMIETPYVA